MGAGDVRNLYSGSVTKSDISKALTKGDDEQSLRTAAKEFTALFVGQMMKIMNSTVDKSEFGHGGEGEEFFQDMLNDEYSRNMAYSEKYGISDMVYKSLQNRNAAAAYKAK